MISGGIGVEFTLRPLGVYTGSSKHHRFCSTNSFDFFDKLCAAISTYSINQPNFKLHDAPCILIRGAHHAFTLDPRNFENILVYTGCCKTNGYDTR